MSEELSAKGAAAVKALVTKIREVNTQPQDLLKLASDMPNDVVWAAIEQSVTVPYRPLVQQMQAKGEGNENLEPMNPDHARLVLVFICLGWLQGKLSQ